MDKRALYEEVLKLSPDDYFNFMSQVHMEYPHQSKELTNRIVNLWRKEQKRDVKKSLKDRAPSGSSAGGSSGAGSNQSSSLQIPASVHKESSDGNSDLESKPKSSLPMPWQKSAWKSGFIFRGDKIPIQGLLFMDVEKVTLRKVGKKHEQKAATISIVNEDGKVILWAFIRRPHESICQYAPKMTNLNRRKLEQGIDIALVHECLKMCLEGNKLVGVAVANDLISLDYEHKHILDLHDFFRDDNGAFALGHIARQLLDNRSGFQQGHHYAIDDARMTLAAYKKLQSLQAIPGGLNSAIQKLTKSRGIYKQTKPKFTSERCSCPS